MLNPSSQSVKKILLWTVQLSVGLLIYVNAIPANAQVYNSSVSAATGGSGRASVEAGDSMYLNPATLPHFRGRHFLASYAKDQLAVSLTDNTEESTIPGGLGFVQETIQANVGGVESDVKIQDIAVSLAEFVKGSFSMGLTGHYLHSSVDNTAKSKYAQTNADLGFSYIVNPNIGLGAVFYNLAGGASNVPEDLRQHRTAGLGFNYIYKEFFRYRIDVLSGPEYHMNQASFMTGFESFLSDFMVWRLGYQNDNNLDRNLITTGIGFNGPKFALNYAYQANTKVAKDNRHSIDLQIPF